VFLRIYVILFKIEIKILLIFLLFLMLRGALLHLAFNLCFVNIFLFLIRSFSLFIGSGYGFFFFVFAFIITIFNAKFINVWMDDLEKNKFVRMFFLVFVALFYLLSNANLCLL
jgi:hypothetical protein